MVNENFKLTVENKKPVEMVYEIKDEYKVPSYEEFMKTYESDGNLDYADLSGGSVGTPNGYGPGLWELIIAKNEEDIGIMNTVANIVKNMRIELSSQNEWVKQP
ncbi:4881_t:CDS:2 [Funneliformis geosporum]|uniref:4881_t:CDS:1 n=1 Tax=Funneliformis geosporum TaxID=1117311 RepID=A0A9W4T4E7_9GLOM|nr:4881_t:CDS:2 [Funneliformis geosporum]